MLRELRALWENNVSRSGAIGEYVGAVKTEMTSVGSGTPVGASAPPKIEQPVQETEPPLKVDESIKVEDVADQDQDQDQDQNQADQDTKTQTDQTNQKNESCKRKLEDSRGDGKGGTEGEEGDRQDDDKQEKQEKRPRQDDGGGNADAQGDEEAGADDELLGSDLDDSEIGELDDVVGQDAMGQVDDNTSANMVLGAFSKVSRSKNRWRVMLNGCVASIGGKDFLFKKLGLDLEWA